MSVNVWRVLYQKQVDNINAVYHCWQMTRLKSSYKRCFSMSPSAGSAKPSARSCITLHSSGWGLALTSVVAVALSWPLAQCPPRRLHSASLMAPLDLARPLSQSPERVTLPDALCPPVHSSDLEQKV